jgi:hypothetical protein
VLCVLCVCVCCVCVCVCCVCMCVYVYVFVCVTFVLSVLAVIALVDFVVANSTMSVTQGHEVEWVPKVVLAGILPICNRTVTFRHPDDFLRDFEVHFCGPACAGVV